MSNIKDIRMMLIATMITLVALGVFTADAALAASVSDVTRSIAEGSGGQNVVTIGINDTTPSVVGLKETLPGRVHAGKLHASAGPVCGFGNSVNFVAVNTTSFQYVVSGLGGKDISGQWTDMLGTGQGTVGAGTSGAGNAGAGNAGAGTQGQSTPGFIAIVAIVSICIAAILLMRRDSN